MDLRSRHIRSAEPTWKEEQAVSTVLDGLPLSHIVERHKQDLNLRLTKNVIINVMKLADLNLFTIFAMVGA